MKKIAIILCACLCFSAFSSSIAFAAENNTGNIGLVNYQPGSSGVMWLDENRVEHFISGDEILSFGSASSVSAPAHLIEFETPESEEPEHENRMMEIAKPEILTSFGKYSPVVRIQAKFEFPDGTNATKWGTGTFIGPKGVLTCAHVLYDRDTKTWANEVNIYTKYVDLNNYGKKYKHKQLYIGGEYINGKNPNLDDWGIITTSETSVVGYLGFDYVTDLSELDGLYAIALGYFSESETAIPAKFAREDVYLINPNARSLPSIYFNGQAVPGFSGGPLLEKGIDDTYVRAIITGEQSYYSRGLAINEWLFNTIYEYSGR